MKIRYKALLAAAMIGSFAFLSMGCGSNNARASRETPVAEEAGTQGVVNAGGWNITVEEALSSPSLENVSVSLGYSDVETSDFLKEAGEGNTFCLIKLLIEKEGTTEAIEWKNLRLTDGDGNEYSRMDDAFLTDLGMLRMSGSTVNFGENEGWIAFEIKENASDLTLSYPFEAGSYEAKIAPGSDLSTAMTGAEKEADTDDNLIVETDFFESQEGIDQDLAEEAEAGHTFEEPNVILNPYGTSPLSAVVVFTTDSSIGGTITVKGKAEEDDITAEFPEGTSHIVPVYGLYNGDTTQVELTLTDGRSTTLEVTTEEQALNVGDISVEMLDESAYDYSKLTLACSSGGALYALDSKGDVRWYYNDCGALGVHQLENGHLMVPTAYTLRTTYYKSGLKEIDFSGKVYNEYAIPGGMHHDFYEMSNGNLLVASDSQDLSAVEDHVVEIDVDNGQVVWELNMADILDITDGASASNLTDGGEEIDWFHNNGVWYDESNDLVLMSARHVDAIVAVHKSDKTLAWILGDPNGWTTVDKSYFFTPVGDNFEWQYAQHQVTMLDNGDIMLFDNGTAKVKKVNGENQVSGDDIYSRAVVYRINTEDMTIEQVFEYGKERGPEWYSDWISGSVSLDGTDGNLWITAGSNLYDPETGSHDFKPSDMFKQGLIKTTHINQVVKGELAYEMVISGEAVGALTYRSFPVDMYPDVAQQDVNTKGDLLGSLGEKTALEKGVSLDGAKELDLTGWNFTLDSSKFTLAGSYTTQTGAEELKEGYLVLANGDEQKVYAIAQIGSEAEEATNVNVTGWTSTDGLEGNVYDIYLVLDGETYQTGKRVQIDYQITHYEADGTDYFGYYDTVADVDVDLLETTNVYENTKSSQITEASMEREETLVDSSLIIDAEIEEELKNKEHTWENPMVLMNPYKISPLTAVIVFHTEESYGVGVTVAGKESANDISGEIDAATAHRVPIVGLYPGEENQVTLELLNEEGEVVESQIISIETDSLPEEFDEEVEVIQSSGESAFGLTMVYGQKALMPYAMDSAGDIRWYLTRETGNYGLYNLSNNRFIFQEENVTVPTMEKPQTTNMYEMDYLGRTYNMYYVANGSHHEVIEKEPGGNLLTLSGTLGSHIEDYIVELDRETGEVVQSLDLAEIFGTTYVNKVDWAHINTVSYNPEEHTILISARNLHSAMKIHWDTKELKWILGNPKFWENTEFAEYVLEPLSEFDWHYCQHTAYEIGADLDNNPDTIQVSIYDNHWQNYRRVSFFDNLENSYAKVFAIDEENMTVDLLKQFESVLSIITSNAIYDEDSNHVFAMSGHVYEEEREGMLYEYDYETGELLNQTSVKSRFYRATEMNLDWNDLAQPMDADENYIKGNLRPAVELDGVIETEAEELPVEVKEEGLAFKLVGNVLYMNAPDHRVSQVIMESDDHTYVYDMTDIKQTVERYMRYVSNIPIPLTTLESGDYQIKVVYKNQYYNTGETFRK